MGLFGRAGRRRSRGAFPGEDYEVAVRLTLEEAFRGTERTVQVDGRSFTARIPRGATDGKTPLRERLDHLIEDMIVGGIRFPDAKREFEKRFLAQVMEIEKGNLSRAAKVLHIHRNTLSKKLQELKLWSR